MKKFFKSLVAIMLVAMMAVALTSCGMPKAETVKKNLEKKDYEVNYVTGTAVEAAAASMGLEGVESIVMGTKDDEFVTVIYFKEAADAKECYDDLKKDMEELDKEEKDNYSYGKSGKVVWQGTKQAVKDAK